MGKEQPAAFYDSLFIKTPEYQKQYQNSRYINLWKSMAAHLQKDIPVLDIGCGPGQTAKFFSDNGFDYVGIDFSAVAIEKATLLNPTSRFICADIEKIYYNIFNGYQLFICETLEHIEGDLLLLQKLGKYMPDTNIVLSVPTFDDPGHVRYFKSTVDVFHRYKPVLRNVHECYQLGAWIVLHGKI